MSVCESERERQLRFKSSRTTKHQQTVFNLFYLSAYRNHFRRFCQRCSEISSFHSRILSLSRNRASERAPPCLTFSQVKSTALRCADKFCTFQSVPLSVFACFFLCSSSKFNRFSFVVENVLKNFGFFFILKFENIYSEPFNVERFVQRTPVKFATNRNSLPGILFYIFFLSHIHKLKKNRKFHFF